MLRIEEYGVARLTCGGWPHALHTALTALKYGCVFAVIGAVYIGRTQGWETIAQRYDAVVFAFAVGLFLGVISQAGWREVLLAETGVTIRSSTRIEDHPPSAVKEIVVHARRHPRVALELLWAEEERKPLVVCGRLISTGAMDDLTGLYSIRYERG